MVFNQPQSPESWLSLWQLRIYYRCPNIASVHPPSQRNIPFFSLKTATRVFSVVLSLLIWCLIKSGWLLRESQPEVKCDTLVRCYSKVCHMWQNYWEFKLGFKGLYRRVILFKADISSKAELNQSEGKYLYLAKKKKKDVSRAKCHFIRVGSRFLHYNSNSLFFH